MAIGTSAAVLAAGGLVNAPPAVAETGTQTCEGPGVSWRVDYEITSSGYGPVAHATGLQRRTLPGGSWTDASTQTWQLRWDHPPNAWDNPFAGPFQQQQGDLAAIGGTPVVTYLSPRFVAPDGACTVYLAPFANGSAGDPKIAVLGNSLTQSLNDSSYNQQHLQGYVQGNLTAAGMRAEVEGHGGRRWVADPGATGLAKADNYLLDEYRGLLRHDPQGYVIELGPNDAGWIALAGTQADRQARLDATITGLRTILDELRSSGKCVVFVTGPDNLATYWTADPWHYAWAAQSINQELRAQASASATDDFKLRDFAQLSANHHTYSQGQDVWFTSDDLHLNGLGKLHLTSEITQAAAQCP
ncbi:SGNH/GDSL hydrolase family protein [Actinomadura livida]|uniref:Lysophospholipase L1-like esterase n=1 Tax=Actinomadura livida TaxID=79909 RepID=A0A7W7IAD7_9ACTN|nr:MULTISPECIES: SGNH/GDSL hydrolase family protein [Actinomadura]MBB4773486.1 lysophospholipase L1-like esterase [Actinomadura catellatispora]